MAHKTPKRSYRGESETFQLIHWLNKASTNKRFKLEYGRVYRIYTSLLEWENRSRNYDKSLLGVSYTDLSKKQQKVIMEMFEPMQSLIKGLNKYKVSPSITNISMEDFTFAIDWKPVSSFGTKTLLIPFINQYIPFTNQDTGIDIPFSEWDAVYRLIQAFNNKHLINVATCDQCKAWYFRRFSHSRFCSTACQQKFYRSNPEFKENRNKYIRNLRSLHNQKLFFNKEDKRNGNKKAR